MREVSKGQFFDKLGNLDAYPSIDNDRWNDEYGYKTYWKLKNRTVLGMTMGSICTAIKKTYYLYV